MCVQQFSASTRKVQPNNIISFALPENRSLKKALGYLEDTYLNFTELVDKYGYPNEQYTIVTKDEYLLTVFRVLSKCERVQPYPVILLHGLIDTSDTWILTGPKSGLAYILANNCYDVWLPNLRGNAYSRKHKYLNPNLDPKYWQFSFDENGFYDLPAIIDYVINVTQQSKVYFVGHSQGTTVFFIMASLRPEYNNKIQLSVHLAPIAFLKNLRSPILKTIASARKAIKAFLDNAGFVELFGKQELIHAITEFLCQIGPNTICGSGLYLATGYVPGTISPRNLAITFGHVLAGLSVKTLAHFGQLVTTGRFQRYDEDKEGNMKRYGTPNPPLYNMSLITSPVVLICAKNDYISTLEDATILMSKLPNVFEQYIVPDPKWSHNNHVWGNNVTETVYDKILYYFKIFNIL